MLTLASCLLQVRQTERAKLQHQLWQRAEGRASARTQAEAVAVLSQVVETTVSANGGLATAAPRTGEADAAAGDPAGATPGGAWGSVCTRVGA